MRGNKMLVLAAVMTLAAQLSFADEVKADAYPDTFVDTKLEAYSQMYGDKPGSNILIMPPINLTNEVEAKEYFYYTLNTQLAGSGWYVYPPILALRTLQEESADSSELFVNADISKFGQIFGADYLLFTTIEKWYKSSGKKNITVTVLYNLRSTRTGKTVYEHEYTYAYDLSGTDKAMAKNMLNNSSSLLGLAISGVATLATITTTAIVTASTQTMDVARYCNAFALFDIPAGPLFGTQGEDADDVASDYFGSYTTKTN
ncbi:MAG: DUF799 family lipoprotein [Treponema sp.]|nr:DUF799 family lipoprotein [Treponema sp.]